MLAAWWLVPLLASIGRRGPALAILGGAVAIGSFCADAFVLPRLYPVFHTGLFVLTLASSALVATEWREVWADSRAEQQGKSRAAFLSYYCQQKGILAGRWATLEEIADSIVFLASDRARYINGTRLLVVGGLSVNPR